MDSTTPLPSTHFFDLVVIGSGPAALAVVARILESRPAALYTEDEHQHLHWLRRVDTSKRPLLQTRKTGRGQERAVIAGPTSASRIDKSKDACDCEGAMHILVIDRLGAWLSNWDRLFKAYRIPHLRSPMFFHPAPADIEALLAFAHRTGRTVTQLANEEQSAKTFSSRKRARCQEHDASCQTGLCADLVEIAGCVGKEVSKHKQKKNRQRSAFSARGKMGTELSMGPAVNERDRKDYFTPSTELFRDFIEQDVVKRYALDNGGKPWPELKDAVAACDEDAEPRRITLARGQVQKLSYGSLHIDGWDHMDGFSVQLADGIRVGAKAAVCAIGPGATPAVPDYLMSKRKRTPQPSPARGPGWCHSTTIGICNEPFPPKALLQPSVSSSQRTLVVIGGGLTSAQICDVAIRSGVPRVILIMRGYMKVKPFDVGLEWVGRYANLEKMRFWQEDDPQKRLEVLRAARNGGSLTPSYAKLMRKYVDQGRLQLRTTCTVTDAKWVAAGGSDIDAGTWTLDVESQLEGKGKRQCANVAPGCPGEGECASACPEDVVHESVQAHYIVSATGAAPSLSKVPFLADLAAAEQVPEYGGLPWLNECLQYGQLPLFCTGAFSALQIGPGAFNLEGMRAAADRIAVRLQDLAIDGSSDGVVTSSNAEQADDQPHAQAHETEPSLTSPNDLVSRFTHFAFHHLPTEVES